MTKFFAGMDVGKVNLDGSDADCGDGISEGDTGVGVGRCVEDDEVGGAFGLLNPSDQFAFNIGLAEFDIGF